MGVSQFYKRFIKEKLRAKIEGLIRKQIWAPVSSLLIDANALIYEAKRALFEKPKEYDAETASRVAKNLALSETEKYKALAEQTWKMIKDRATFIRPSKYIVIAFDGVVPVAKMKQQRQRRFRNQILAAQKTKVNTGLDNNLVSVGTDLMEYIHNHIQNEIDSLSYDYDVVFPSIVIYSSYHQVGEGEHKIVKYFRDNVIDSKTDEYHVIWGLDADLFMLGITLPTDKVILARDDGIIEFVDLEKFKNFLAKEMRVISYVDDFLIIMAMMGNDFLPRLFAFNDLGTDIQLMLDKYKKLRLKDADFHLTFNKEPDFKHLFKFIASLNNEQWAKLEARIKDSTSPFLTQFKGHKLEEEFPKIYYLRELTYLNLGQSVNPEPDEIEQLKAGMAYYYFQGIAWIIAYYLKGINNINKSFFYPYMTAPLTGDLTKNNYEAGTNDYWSHVSAYNLDYNILDQLFMTAPANSAMLNWYSSQIREHYQPLTDLAPATFETTAEGSKVMWFDEPLLPQLDPLEVHEITAQYYDSQQIYDQMPFQFKTTSRDTQLRRNLKRPEIPRTTSVNQVAQGRFNTAMTPEQRNLLRLTQGFHKNRSKIGRKNN